MIIKKSCLAFILLLCTLFVPIKQSIAQFEPHPEKKWFTIETEHFYVNFHEGAERTAKVVAKIAEEVYGPITSLYNHEPNEKLIWIISDVSDLANGATDFFGNRIEIFATPLDFDLRGTTNWLRNVITHEFVHAIQLQAAMKFGRSVPAVYLQWLNYEQERRPDVLYGYPNVIMSYPISGIGVPAWFAEGTAQYQRQQLGYDGWDAHRDMILRMQVLGDNMLSWNEMGQFSSITSLKAESIYNSGFNLTRYIAKTYGEDKLKEITYALGELTNFSFDKAVRQVIGKDGDQLYNEWKAYLTQDYNRRLGDLKSNQIKGELIEKTGFVNYYPKFSPDGKKIAFISNQKSDFGGSALYIYDTDKKEKEFIAAPVFSNFDWSPDGRKIIFSSREIPPNVNGESFYDLYEVNVSTQDKRRLTFGQRALTPAYSKDGSKIAFTVNGDGTLNLYVSDANGRGIRPVTYFKSGEQLYNPVFLNNGVEVIVDYALNENRKLAKINTETGVMEFILDEPGIDFRTAAVSKDDSTYYFSSDVTGIFNIYALDLPTGEVSQLTNVLGGAFMPSVNEQGDLTYASFESDGYKIALLNEFYESDPLQLASYDRPPFVLPQYSGNDNPLAVGKDNFEWDKLREFDDTKLESFTVKPYTSLFTKLFFFPVLRYDNYTKGNKFLDAIKPGVYFYSDEAIGRFSIFGGASINRNLERDLFMQFDYRNGVPFLNEFFGQKLKFTPEFSLAGYNVTRKTTADLIASIDTIPVEVAYDLLSFDVSMDWKMINYNHNFRFMYTFSKYASSLEGFVIPQSGIFIRSSSQDYFKANNFSLRYSYRSYMGSRNRDINPIGRNLWIQLDHEISDINPELEVEDGNLISRFKKNNLNKLSGELTESIGLFGNDHVVSLKLAGATIFGPPVDDFYNFYASGLPGMKGYPFYALGGGRMAYSTLTYRFPVFKNIDTRISPLYLDKLYMSLYGSFGNAWDADNVKLSDFKKDIGAQLRLQAFTSYVFPTSIFFDAAYGLDSFTRTFQNKDVTYGKEWRFYFGMLFGFDLGSGHSCNRFCSH